MAAIAVVVLVVVADVVVLLLDVLEGLALLELLEVPVGLLLCARQSPVMPRNNVAMTRYDFFIRSFRLSFTPPPLRLERPDEARSLGGLI